MRSPFPGMDPFLEDPAFWRDFHARFNTYLCDELADRLPDQYEARIDERVRLVQMDPESIKLIAPDVAVEKRPGRPSRSGPATGGVALLEPMTIPHEFLEEVRETRVQVLHRPDRTVIAILELLSPSNKNGDGFDQYQAKRVAVRTQRVHLLELDLLLSGKRLTHRRPLPDGDYYAFLTRSERRDDCEVYSWSMQDPLPSLPIPLQAPDPDVHIDFQKVFETTYERGRYARSLQYDRPLPTALSEDSQKWIADQLTARALG